jgi:sphingomyelin phosphodiesterase
LNSVLPANASYPIQQEDNYKNVSAAWENYGWLSHSEAQEVVTSGLGIYRAVTAEGLVIISLNSDVWYQFNLYAYIGGNKVDTTGMFATLIDYLLEAESKNQPVWLIQHVNSGGSTGYEALPAASDLYYQIVDRFNNTIRGNFFGHTHNDEYSVFYANNATVQNANTAASVAYIGPSVTSYTNLNAGFRYYLVDPDTFDILDSVNYYANISNAKAWEKAGDVKWEFEYSARSTYDPLGKLVAPDYPLSAAFWHQVTDSISANDTMFKTYTDLRQKKFRPYTPVTGAARNLTLCGLRSMSVPIFEQCLGSMASTTSFL